jgi:hypothetical protein
MPATVILDTIENSRVDDSLMNGMVIERGVVVKDMDWTDGASPAEVWAKALLVPGMPAKGTAMSPSYPAILVNRRLAGISGFTKTVRGTLVYTAPPLTDGQPISWTITDATQTAHVLTSTTADGGDNLYTLYKANGSTTVAQTDADARDYSYSAPKIVTFRTLRASGFMTGDAWRSVKANIRLAAGTLNSGNWGSDSRGWWLFLGPISRTTDQGAWYHVQLDFVRAERQASFYPIGFYRRRWDGAIPKDAATEDEVLAPGLPVVGGIYRTNGASIASIYPEAAWMGLFTFTPDT